MKNKIGFFLAMCALAFQATLVHTAQKQIEKKQVRFSDEEKFEIVVQDCSLTPEQRYLQLLTEFIGLEKASKDILRAEELPAGSNREIARAFIPRRFCNWTSRGFVPWTSQNVLERQKNLTPIIKGLEERMLAHRIQELSNQAQKNANREAKDCGASVLNILFK